MIRIENRNEQSNREAKNRRRGTYRARVKVSGIENFVYVSVEKRSGIHCRVQESMFQRERGRNRLISSA